MQVLNSLTAWQVFNHWWRCQEEGKTLCLGTMFSTKKNEQLSCFFSYYKKSVYFSRNNRFDPGSTWIAPRLQTVLAQTVKDINAQQLSHTSPSSLVLHPDVTHIPAKVFTPFVSLLLQYRFSEVHWLFTAIYVLAKFKEWLFNLSFCTCSSCLVRNMHNAYS